MTAPHAIVKVTPPASAPVRVTLGDPGAGGGGGGGGGAHRASGNRHAALFVGQWVAPFLLLGVYNKIVKVAGPDRVSG